MVVKLFPSLSIITIVFIYTMTTTTTMMVVCASDARNEEAPSSAELVNNICNKTSSYEFCADALYSDPQTPGAEDYNTLAYVSFRLADINSTTTQRYISRLLKDKNSTTTTTTTTSLDHDHDHELLRRCHRYYKKAILVLGQALNDLNSDSFALLPKYAAETGRAADDCQALFQGSSGSPLTVMNGYLKGLADICLIVSKFANGLSL